MKKIIIAALLPCIVSVFLAIGNSGSNPINKNNCSYKGFKLYGKVMVVNSFPDIKVQAVSAFPDLKVESVSSFPDSCGKWQFVNSFPDLKVQYVSSFPDIKIMMVKSFPGVN
jgi:hypothetical protein